MQEYVVGFMFSNKLNLVVLIQKTKPAWQAGKWNGVGGKVEPGELPIDAMIREYEEETGVLHDDWTYYATQTGRESIVHLFYAVDNLALKYSETVTDEKIDVHEVRNLPVDVVFNAPWEIAMALAHFRSATPWTLDIKYNYEEAA